MTAVTIAQLSAAVVLTHLAVLSMPEHAKLQRPLPAALSGRVSSQQEAQMEGVLVSAKREGSTIRRYGGDGCRRDGTRFPQNRLEPGHILSPSGQRVTRWIPASGEVTSRKGDHSRPEASTHARSRRPAHQCGMAP